MARLSRRVFVGLALSAGALLLAGGLAEVGLRLFSPVSYRAPPGPIEDDAWFGKLNRPSPIEGLGYELAPDARTVLWDGIPVRTNSLGLRDDELRPDFEGKLRIAVLGDSVTFGVGVTAQQTYPSVLEARLADSPAGHGRSFEVLNLGVSGYSTRDEALVLEHKALPLRPDLLVIGYVFNDPEIDPVQPLHAYFQEPRWWQASHLLRLGARMLQRRAVQTLGGGRYLRYLHHEPRKWGSVLTAFAEMARVAGEHELPAVLVIFPSIPGPPAADWSGYIYDDLHERVGQAARAAGFGVLDLRAAYGAHAPAALRLSARDGHPSVLGHAVAAEALAGFLLADPERWMP